MKTTSMYLFLAALLLATFIQPARAISRDALVSYASALKGKKKAELKTAIYGISQPETTLDYGSGTQKTWWGFYATDRVAATNECVNRYSSSRFYFSGSRGTVVSGMNIEHSFPKSWWGGTKNTAYRDLFNLYPSDSEANSSKGNFPMGVVETVTNSSGDGYDLVGSGTIDGESGVQCWEPGNQYKGDFARGYMYMATTYQNFSWASAGTLTLTDGDWPTLKQWAYTLYIEWAAADSVSQLETERNDAVYAIQGNRNLFIDFPHLADYVWGDSVDVPFDPATSITTAEDDTRYKSEYGNADKGSGGEEGGDDNKGTDDGNGTGGNETGGDENQEENDTLSCLHETFDQCAGEGGGDGSFSSGGSGTFTPDLEGWECSKSFGGDRCARFGTGKVAADVTTPAFTIPAGQATVSLVVAPWGTDDANLQLSIYSGDATLSQTTFTMEEGAWTTFTTTLTATQETAVQLRISTGKRFWMDDFAVYQLKDTDDNSGDGTGDNTGGSDDNTGGQNGDGTGDQTGGDQNGGDDGNTDVEDGVETIAPTDAESSLPIYDLSGRRRGTDSSLLPDGIYIRGGQKFRIR